MRPLFSLLARRGEQRGPSKTTMADNDVFDVEDGSNDKAYFTMVPNIVLNHSSAVDQALYMQMKRFAGEKSGGGLCTASHRTLMSKLKIGPKALKTSLDYLIGHGWIENVGSRKIMTPGGPQEVQMYRVNDIWKLNVQHYKGANESAPLLKGGDERKQGADERSKGGDESATTKNYIKQIDTSVAIAPPVEEVVISFSEEEGRVRKPAKYPKAREVFSWFPEPEPSWKINTTECKHAELLFARGETDVKGIVKFCLKYEDMPFFPKWRKPSALERNWNDIIDFAKRNDL